MDFGIHEQHLIGSRVTRRNEWHDVVRGQRSIITKSYAKRIINFIIITY